MHKAFCKFGRATSAKARVTHRSDFTLRKGAQCVSKGYICTMLLYKRYIYIYPLYMERETDREGEREAERKKEIYGGSYACDYCRHKM